MTEWTVNNKLNDWYQKQYHIKLPKKYETKSRLYFSTAPVSSFSPIDLFATGSKGIWLDPSDLTTMFSDRAGTTPVTTPGTVVGLRLDKSKGLALGSELVTNGDFSGGTTGWTPQASATISVEDGQLKAVSSATTFTGVWQELATVAGKTYRLTASMRGTAGTLGASVFNGAFASIIAENLNYPENGILTAGSLVFTAISTQTRIIFSPGATATTYYIDNISVRELAGNHAVAPTDAARPTYGVEPKGGQRNLLEWTEDATNAYWTKVGLPTAASSAGFSTLTENTSNSVHSLSRPSVTTPTAYTNFTLSASFKAGSRRYVQLQFDNGSQAVGVVIDTQLWSATPITGSGTVTSYSIVEEDASTYRVKVSGIYTSGTFVANAVVYGLSSATQSSVTYTGNGSTIIVGKLQLETGSTATNYQRVTTAYDITESGVATCHYVQYDGSDDSLSTSAIDFTATDKMSVFAGVRKLGTAIGVIAEFSANADTNAGVFSLASDALAASQYFTKAVGSTVGGGYQSTASPYVSPHSAVTSSILDIAGSTLADKVTLRVNGTASTTRTQSGSGTGNFGSYPLFIGRRNNASLPFNGKDYGIIVVGKAASAGEITDTELWLSDKTAEVDVAKSISPNIYTRSGDTILDRANSIIERRTV